MEECHMTQPIWVIWENLHHIDYDSIVAFFYAEEGAMGGNAGTLTFSAADGTTHRLDYSRGPVPLGAFCRAYHDGALTVPPVLSRLTWQHFYLGEGNHFLAHNILVNKLHNEEPCVSEEAVFLRWQERQGTPLLSKEERYRWLIQKARYSYPPKNSPTELTWCDACQDEINLWTYWQGRGCLDPEIVVVGQDWGCPDKKEGGIVLENLQRRRSYLDGNLCPTDLNLAKLFLDVLKIDLARRDRRLFFTNLLLGYRTGNNSGHLNTPLARDLPFFKELINILRPKLVICLGEDTFKYALRAWGARLPYTGSYTAALEAGKTTVDVDGVRFIGMAHCGTMGCLNRAGKRKGGGAEAGLQLQKKDWEQIRNYR